MKKQIRSILKMRKPLRGDLIEPVMREVFEAYKDLSSKEIDYDEFMETLSDAVDYVAGDFKNDYDRYYYSEFTEETRQFHEDLYCCVEWLLADNGFKIKEYN